MGFSTSLYAYFHLLSSDIFFFIVGLISATLISTGIFTSVFTIFYNFCSYAGQSDIRIDSQSHCWYWKEPLKGTWFKPPAIGRDITTSCSSKPFSNLILNNSKDGSSTTSPGNMFQWQHPHCKKFLPYVQFIHMFFQFKIISPCSVTTGHGKKSFSFFLISFL